MSKLEKSFVKFIFVVCQVGGCQNISKLIRRPLAFISYKAFLKKRGLKLVSLLHFQFLLDFSRKLFLIFSCSDCKQTSHIPHVRISQKVKGVLM